MITWGLWFVTWLGVGFALFQRVTRSARKHYSFFLISQIMLVWILFSAGAAEVIRYYLAIAPFPPFVCAMAGLGVATIGALGGLAAGWFIGGRSFGRTADILAGILGALISAWAEITASYSHFDCAAALIVVGPLFATLALRLYARSKIPFEESGPALL